MRKVVMFDFDGVIVDSFEVGYAAFEIEFEGDRDTYRGLFNGNLFSGQEKKKLIPKVLPLGYTHDEFIKNARSSLQVYKGMYELLHVLKGSYSMFIITSSSTKNVSDWMQERGLGEVFKEVLGYDVALSKSEKIKYVLQKYNMIAQDCYFVTDTTGDIHEAKEEHVESIAVSWGFHNEEKLSPLAIKVVRSAEELGEYLLGN